MDLSPSQRGTLPYPSSLSELDGLSDSDWLDVASGRDSDDNDSLSGQDSDRDDISSLPRSRRSSISNDDSMSSDVEAWEGFVSDSGDAVIGMYPVPLPSPLGAEPIALGDIPDIDAADPALSDEERRVKEALDQSFVGTLNSSRTSAHTSIRDLRLSFPDPLTSSRNDLNRSYESVSAPTEIAMVVSAEDVTNVPDIRAPDVVHSQLEDPGLFTTPVVQHEQQEVQLTEPKDVLEVVLYGASSEIKWKFLQQLIDKAAMSSGRLLNTGIGESTRVQRLSLIKASESFTPFFDAVEVTDRTYSDLLKSETDNLNSLERPSLAIVYLPVAKLPNLSWHSLYLPVAISPIDAADPEILVHAAEDDWDLLGVPSSRTLKLGSGKSHILVSDELENVDSTQLYEALRNMGRDIKKETVSKALGDQVNAVNAVKIFALVSIIVGFAFNTNFRAPTPTPTVNVPTGNTQTWNFFSPQPNRSIIANQHSSSLAGSALTATPSLKEMALSVFDPGSTSLSVTSPPSAKSLSITTTSNSVAKLTTTSPTATCRECDSKPGSSTDIISLPTSLTPSIFVRPSGSLVSIPRSASTILLAGAERAASVVAPVASGAAGINTLNAVTEAFDATTKALAEAVGNDLAELVDAADDLLVSIREQTDNVIRQSKGKARAFGEHIQNLNEEFVSRNERAKRRARELKKRGEDLVRGATREFHKRTTRAKKRARALKKMVEDGGTEAWKTYEKSQADLEGTLTGLKDGKENTVPWWSQSHGCRKNSGGPRISSRDPKIKRACVNQWL